MNERLKQLGMTVSVAFNLAVIAGFTYVLLSAAPASSKTSEVSNSIYEPLNLTAEQKQQRREMHARSLQRLIELRRGVKARWSEIVEALAQPEPDWKVVDAKHTEMLDLVREYQQVYFHGWVESKRILTPEQKQKLFEVIQARTGEWSYERAAHLLERAGFGGTPEEIEKLAAMSPQQTVRFLVRYQEVKNVEFPPFEESGIFPSPNIRYLTVGPALRECREKGSSLGVKFKESGEMRFQPVVDQSYFLRYSSLREMQRAQRWLAGRMLTTRRPLQEKLALFWHGHFATSIEKLRDHRKMLWQYDLLREKGNTDLRELLIGIAKDPAMLFYLDNRENVKGRPNENFAREIMELFSMGPGNYTETDIKEAARAFTGWTDDGMRFVERPDLHDAGEKTFLGQKGNFDGAQIINIILEQKATAHFIARKLYRYFVREELSPELENKLAASLRGGRDGKYEIAPLLELIFLSRDFYSLPSYATQIKSPVHLIVSTYKKLGLTKVPGLPNFRQVTSNLGQEVSFPPNVKGWDGGRTWINPSTMFQRANFARSLLFPNEAPPPLTHDQMMVLLVRGVTGSIAFDEMTAMARRGDYQTPPSPRADESGVDMLVSKGQDYNLFRGLFNGAHLSLERVKPDPRDPADFSLASMLRSAKVNQAAGAVDYFARRFLRVPLKSTDRDLFANFLAQRLGSRQINFTSARLESDLRELLHLILSTPEYQLA